MSSRTRRPHLLTAALFAAGLPLFHTAHAGPVGRWISPDDPNPTQVASDETVTGDRIGIESAHSQWILINEGTIRGNGRLDTLQALPEGGVTFYGGPATITNSGDISGLGTGITTAYWLNAITGQLEGRATNSTVTNTGTITGDTNDGVRLIGGGTVHNSGTIRALQGAFSDGVSMYGYADQPTSSFMAVVNNAASGDISGTRYGLILTGNASIENAGSVSGFNGGIWIQGSSNATDTDPPQHGSIINSGTITGLSTNPDEGLGVGFGGLYATASLVNSGSISGPIKGVNHQSAADLTLDNLEGGTITGGMGVYAGTGTLTLNNAGTIRGTGNYDGIDFPPDAGVTIATRDSSVNNTGTISGHGAGISTAYQWDSEQNMLVGVAVGTNVTNSGTILGETNDGVRLIGGGTVTNSGSITGEVGDFTDGVSMYAFQDQAQENYSALVDNAAEGTIAGARFGVILSGGGEVRNAGDIEGVRGGIFIQGTALDSETRSGVAGVVTNSGRIASTATSGANGHGVGFGSDMASATLINSGQITSAIAAGVLQGSLGAFSLTNEANGTIEGGKYGVLASGAGEVTIDNAGTIRGNGPNVISANDPNNAGITVLSGNGVITNSGTISGASYGIVTQYYFNSETQQFEVRAVNTTINNSGTIQGDTNDAIRLFGGGTIHNSGTISGVDGETTDGITIQAFGAQDTSDSTVLGTVTNAITGVISGVRYGALLVPGGSMTNAGTLEGGVSGLVIGSQGQPGKTAELINTGSIVGGVELDVDNATVDNSGSIVDDDNAGIQSFSHLVLTNREGAEIVGSTSGIRTDRKGSLTLDNAGTIRGNGTYDGFDAPPDAGVTVATGPSTITNSGTISGAGAGITTAYGWDPQTQQLLGVAVGTNVTNSGTIIGETNDGVRLIGGGTVTNSGSISALAGDFSDGISMYGFNGQAQEDLSNAVDNQAGGSISGSRFGIILSGGGEVVNAGSIAGSDGGVFIQGTALNAEVRSGASATLINSGSITGSRADGTNGYGVGFGSDMVSATLENSGTITSEASSGVFHGTLGTFHFNNAQSGVVTGGTTGVRLTGAGEVTLDNAGTIRGNGMREATEENYADAGIVLTSGNAVITNSGTISGARDGISTQLFYNSATQQYEARAINTSIINTGTIKGDSNVAIQLMGGGMVDNSGTIDGALGGVVIEREGQTDTMADIINGGTILGGVHLDVDTVMVDNWGEIRNANGAAVTSTGQTDLINDGVIAGSDGVAVQLGAHDDSVLLLTGSNITGRINAGDGLDALMLAGDSETATDTQVLAGTSGFESLTVAAGYWTGSGIVSTYGDVAILEGATLQIRDVLQPDGWGTAEVQTSHIGNDGRLVLNFSYNNSIEPEDDFWLDGAGSVELIGPGSMTLASDTVLHTGGTIISNGTLTLTGTLLGDVTTNGTGTFVLGDGGTEGNFNGNIFNNGRFVFNRSDDYDFNGAFSGSGLLEKHGAGSLAFMGDYTFTGVTRVMGGSIRFGGLIDPSTQFELEEGTLDLSGQDQTIGGLAGGEDSGVEIGDTTLTIDQDDDSVFEGTINGDGGLIKTGDGTLNLTGDNTYTGPTIIDDGTLAVNGSITSPVLITDGGTLGGNGTVGTTTAGGGAVIAPGNSIGRLTVAGNLSFGTGSTYQVETNAAGAADRLDATGNVTIASGVGLQVLAESGAYKPRTDYTILTGAQGITGTFGTVTSNLAFLTPYLRYGTNALVMSLYRNDVRFDAVAAGSNQVGVARAIQARGINDPMFEALLMQSATGAQAAYTDLSGELHAASASAISDASVTVRSSLLNVGTPVDDGAFVWATAFGGSGEIDSKDGMRGVDSEHNGILVGAGYRSGNFAGMLAAGAGNGDVDLKDSSDSADLKSRYMAGQVVFGKELGMQVKAGFIRGDHDVDSERSATVAGATQDLMGTRDIQVDQLFGELGYGVARGASLWTPFLRVASVSTTSDALTETGGTAALKVQSFEQKTTHTSVGIRGVFLLGNEGLQPYVSVAWTGISGDRRPVTSAAFATGGNSWELSGVSLPKSSTDIELGIGYRAGQLQFKAGYAGRLSSDRNVHSYGLNVTYRF